jgi:predicted choloylglycine hydrolase
MHRHLCLGAGGLLVALGLVVLPARNLAQDKGTARGVLLQDRVVAGGPKDFLEVRHVVLKGSNADIGRALATLARERFRTEPLPSSDPLRTRVQRRYFQEHYPILFERMRGVASAFGGRLDDDTRNYSVLGYPGPLRFGCSVVHYPPSTTATGAGIVSRNYDFTTGTLMGTRPPPGELPATARPYLVEMHPDRGYASLAMYSYDMLNGVLDGINSEGLTVSLLADDELMNKFPLEPAGQDAVGLGVLQMQRLLLDTCANVDEAKQALLLTKQYYEFIPVHYLIADRHGNAFVWEYSHTRNREHIIANPGKPLITTNFSLHRHLEGKKPPSARAVKEVCPRYCALAERLAGQAGKLTVDFIKESHKVADAIRPAPKAGPRAPVRTLWHALYFPEQRKVQISFYLRDEPEAGQPGNVRVVRSDYLEFRLGSTKAGKE